MKISVIVPCYNQANFLDEALESVFRQTYQNWECVIINDGSEDNTAEVSRKWLEKDERFKYLAQENKGLSGARNTGLHTATGEFIQFLDADDVIDKMKFETSLRAVQNDRDISIVVSNFRTFTTSSEDTYPPYCQLSENFLCFKNILIQWPTISIPVHCGLFKAELFEEFRFPEELKAVEDWVMWVSLFKKDPKSIFMDEPLAFYRRQAKSLTVNQQLMDQNLKKAISYLQEIVSQEDYMYLSFMEMQRQYKVIKRLERKINQLQLKNRTGFLGKVRKLFFS